MASSRTLELLTDAREAVAPARNRQTAMERMAPTRIDKPLMTRLSNAGRPVNPSETRRPLLCPIATYRLLGDQSILNPARRLSQRGFRVRPSTSVLAFSKLMNVLHQLPRIWATLEIVTRKIHAGAACEIRHYDVSRVLEEYDATGSPFRISATTLALRKQSVRGGRLSHCPTSSEVA